MSDYRVALDSFHGPLDLLLYLVKRNELDVRDVVVSQVIEQFQEFMQTLELMDLDVVGEFLVISATLLEIKSRLPETQTEPEDENDPRYDLVKQLVEYRKFKTAATALEERAEIQQQRYPRQALAEPSASGPQAVRPVELWDLVAAFGRLIRETQATQTRRIVMDETPLHVHQEQIRQRLQAVHRLPFLELFTPPYDRGRLIGLFLALLELVKLRQVILEAGTALGEIVLVSPNTSAEPTSSHDG